jgi:hypothetical protein
MDNRKRTFAPQCNSGYCAASFDHLVGAGENDGGTARPSALAALKLMPSGRQPSFFHPSDDGQQLN